MFGRKRRKVPAPTSVVFQPQPEAAPGGPEKAARRKVEFPRFQATATDQLDRRGSDKFSLARMKLRNAFTPSQPVTDRQLFSGRSELLMSMIRAIEDQRLHLVIYGERGIGKTSLLHMLAEAARDARYIVFYSSCGAASEFEETFRAAIDEIPVLFHSGFAPTNTDAEMGHSLSGLLPSGSFSPRQLADVCSKLTGTRVLIVLDEFDRAGNPSFRRDVSELMKFLSDRSVRVQLVVAGVAADLAELLEYAPSIRRNLLAVRVPLMSDAEVQAIVANGEAAAGLAFDSRARDLVVAFAHGSPYLASLFSHHAGLIALDAGLLTVDRSHVVSALDQALREIQHRIAKQELVQIGRFLKEGLGPNLAAIAGVALREGGDFDLADLDSEIASEDLADCKALVERLAKAGTIIERCKDDWRKDYCFIEEGVRHYLWCYGARLQAEEGVKATRRATVA